MRLSLTIACMIISLLTQLFLPFMASYAAHGEVERGGLFGDKILICTSNGFQWVSLKDIENGEHEERPACPLCLLAACYSDEPELPLAAAWHNPLTLTSAVAYLHPQQGGYLYKPYTLQPAQAPPPLML